MCRMVSRRESIHAENKQIECVGDVPAHKSNKRENKNNSHNTQSKQTILSTQNTAMLVFLFLNTNFYLAYTHTVPFCSGTFNFQTSSSPSPSLTMHPHSFQKGHSSFLKLSVSNISLHLGTSCCESSK